MAGKRGAGAFPRCVGISAPLDGEQQQERDQQRENAERFGHREAEDQPAELAVDRARIAQRAVEELAEQRADADAGGARSDRREARADVLGGDREFVGFYFSRLLLFSVCWVEDERAVSDRRDEWRR